jgi:hypothetical protein
VNAAELRRKLENQPEQMPYRKSLLKVLTDIEALLSNQPLDLIRLSKAEFGIFRMVTDSKSLEESSTGKELLSYLKELYLLRQAIKESHEKSD